MAGRSEADSLYHGPQIVGRSVDPAAGHYGAENVHEFSNSPRTAENIKNRPRTGIAPPRGVLAVALRPTPTQAANHELDADETCRSVVRDHRMRGGRSGAIELSVCERSAQSVPPGDELGDDAARLGADQRDHARNGSPPSASPRIRTATSTPPPTTSTIW